MKLSLSNRISLVVISLIACFGMITGYALYDKVRRSITDEIQGRQNVRLAWIESCLEFDQDHIEMEGREVSNDAAEIWQVSTRDGRVLWKSSTDKKNFKGMRLSSERRLIEVGSHDSIFAQGEHLRAASGPNGEVMYFFPKNHMKIELILVASTPSEALFAELSRLRLALFAVIPTGVFLIAGLLAWFIRRQLRSLATIAHESTLIGPSSEVFRIQVVPDSIEIQLLRDSINGMIARMVDGLERERRFSSYAAHELRTPLAQMRTNIEVTLRRERTNVEYKEYLREALLDIERLQKLVFDLLNLTRAQELIVTDKDRASVETIILQAVRTSGAHVSVPSKVNVFVKGNEELLIAALRNVLENVGRYAPEGQPAIAVDATDEDVTVAITDCGPGIPETERERVFLPLTRLDAARSITDRIDGFGLGLAIARAAVRAGGGDLFCTDRDDGKNGARFVFKLKSVAPAF